MRIDFTSWFLNRYRSIRDMTLPPLFHQGVVFVEQTVSIVWSTPVTGFVFDGHELVLFEIDAADQGTQMRVTVSKTG
jgi:hypothetical protein